MRIIYRTFLVPLYRGICVEKPMDLKVLVKDIFKCARTRIKQERNLDVNPAWARP